MHFHAQHAVALAGFGAATAYVETEAAGVVAARPRLGDLREQLPDRGEQAGVGRRVGARRAADRVLVDVDHALEALQPRDRAAGREALQAALV